MLELIKKYEGCKLKAYKCPAGVWTIGYGHTYEVKKSDIITQEEAEAFLRQDVQRMINFLNSLKLRLNPNQMKALVSFIFNIGQGAFLRSTLFKYLAVDNYDKRIYNEFLRWTKVTIEGKKVELQGLVNRRKEEADLYYTP